MPSTSPPLGYTIVMQRRQYRPRGAGCRRGGLRCRGAVGDDRGMPALTSVPVSALPYERFAPVLGPDRFAQFRDAADHARKLLDGRVVFNVNSTARGGGVAEMLVSLLAYA